MRPVVTRSPGRKTFRARVTRSPAGIPGGVVRRLASARARAFVYATRPGPPTSLRRFPARPPLVLLKIKNGVPGRTGATRARDVTRNGRAPRPPSGEIAAFRVRRDGYARECAYGARCHSRYARTGTPRTTTAESTSAAYAPGSTTVSEFTRPAAGESTRRQPKSLNVIGLVARSRIKSTTDLILSLPADYLTR